MPHWSTLVWKKKDKWIKTILASKLYRSMLFLAFSCWSMPLLTFSGRSILCLDFSLLSPLALDFSLWSVLSLGFSLWSVLMRDFSLRSVLGLDLSLLSVLFLRFSGVNISLQSVLFLGFSGWSIIGPDPFLRCGDFSMADINFLRCFMYCGKSSRSQWFPPLIHNGSYFSLQSSQSCLPWDQPTTSSAVPYKRQIRSKTAWKMSTILNTSAICCKISYLNVYMIQQWVSVKWRKAANWYGGM